MKEILEKLDLQEEVKASLLESFEKAIQEKTSKLDEEFEAKTKDLQEYAETTLSEKAKEQEAEFEAKMDEVVATFIQDNSEKIQESVDAAKADAIKEGISAILDTVGIDVAKELNESSVTKELEDKLDEALSTIADLEEKIQIAEGKEVQLAVMGLVSEISKDLDEDVKEVFLEKADLLDVETLEEAEESLDKLAKELVEAKAEKEAEEKAKAEKEAEELAKEEAEKEAKAKKEKEEAEKEAKLQESAAKYKPAASHLF